MTTQSIPSFHTVNSEWLASFAAGGLSPARRLMIECQTSIQSGLNPALDRLDEVGAVFLESAKGETLSGDFTSRLSERLDAATDTVNNTEVTHKDMTTDCADDQNADPWMPEPLHEFLQRSEIKLNWKKSGPGVERAPLVDENGERLYLLKARSGMKMPAHSHQGEEWTLILDGGYHVGSEAYVRGDLHCENASRTHQPIIDDHGTDCISLVYDEGKLKFSNPIMRLIQPLVGI